MQTSLDTLPFEIQVYIASYASNIHLRRVNHRFKKVVDQWLENLNQDLASRFCWYNVNNPLTPPAETCRMMHELMHKLGIVITPKEAFTRLPELCTTLTAQRKTYAFDTMVKVIYNDYHRIDCEKLKKRKVDRLWAKLKTEKVLKVNLDSDKRKRLGIIEFVLTLHYLPEQIGDLSSLETLLLQKNCLQELPASIGRLQLLKHLDLTSNRLVNLPPEIGNLSYLETLILAYNKMVRIPPEIGKLGKLVTLDVSNNCLEELPWQMVNLTALINLTISNNSGIKHLPFSPDSFPKLKRFAIDFFQQVALFGTYSPFPSTSKIEVQI